MHEVRAKMSRFEVDRRPAAAPAGAIAVPEPYTPPWLILAVSFASLLAGHLLLREYMPNPGVGVVGFLLLVVLQGYVLIARNDLFGFLMVVYTCSHFGYADNQGGLWATVAAILLLARMSFGMRLEFRRKDNLVTSLLVVLFLWNLMGWILRSPVPYVERVEGALAYIGFLLAFYVMSSLIITPARFRTFLVITTTMLIYQVAVAVNQRYAILNWNTPLLGAYSQAVGAYSEAVGAITYRNTNAWGTIRHSELFGEYGALFWTLLIPILCCSQTQKVVRVGVFWIVLSMVLCLVIIAITSTRSAALLAAAAVGLYMIVLTMKSFKSVDRFGRQVQLAIVLAVLVPLAGAFFGLGSLEDNFAELAGTRFTTSAVLSGQAINRAPLFDYALQRLGSDSWLIGYGFSTLRSNLWAWTGVDPLRAQVLADYHSLYLSLPVVYGWVGTVAFLWLLVLAPWRVWRAALRHSQHKSFFPAAALGFTMFWVVFLGDQFKISVLRIPTYHMMFWIWLGLTMALARTLSTPAKPPAQAPAPPAEEEPPEEEVYWDAESAESAERGVPHS